MGNSTSSGSQRHDIVERLSRFFERVGGWSYDHRVVVATLCALALGAAGWLAGTVRVDNGFQVWFAHKDPTYLAYLDYRDEFGSDEMSYIVYEAPEAEHGPWNLEVMRKIVALTETLEDEVPFVRDVTSPANAELLIPVEDGIDILDVSEDFPETQQEMLAVRDRFLSKEMFVGGLVSADGKYAAFMIEMDRSSIDPADVLMVDPEGGEAIENYYPQASFLAIEEILARPEYDGIVFHHTGDVALNATMNIITASESVWLGLGCFAVVGALLFFFFRSVIGVIGPLAVVLLAMMMSVAMIALFGWEVNSMFIMMPTLITAVGVADSVHIISEFRALEAELGDRREALARTMYLVATPCLLTSLTTAAGFGVMSTAPIRAISEFGIYAAAGVIAAFFLSITLLMVFLTFLRPSRYSPEEQRQRAKGGPRTYRAFAAIARFDLRYPRAILAVSAAIFVFSLVGMTRVRVDSNFLDDFGEDQPVRITTELVDKVMGGIMSMVYVFDSGEPEGVKDPAVMRQIEGVANAAERAEIVAKTYSVADIVADINETFHDGDKAFFAIPETRDLIAQYLLLYELSGGEEAGEFLSGDFARASLELRCRLVESSHLKELVENVDAYRATQAEHPAEVTLTGIGSLWIQLMEYITVSQLRSFLLALVAISVMMCIVFRSIRIGLISMLPNLAPVLLTVGGMGWLDISLDYVKLLIAPVAIGIAVDDTIHHVTRFRHEFSLSGNYEKALHASMHDVGRALFITSTVLVLGFLVFTASALDAQETFGVLLGITIITALIADYFLMPALVLTLKPFGPETNTREAGIEY